MVLDSYPSSRQAVITPYSKGIDQLFWNHTSFCTMSVLTIPGDPKGPMEMTSQQVREGVTVRLELSPEQERIVRGLLATLLNNHYSY